MRLLFIISFIFLLPDSCVLLPLHLIIGNQSDFFVRSSISSIKPGSDLLWIHLVLSYLYSFIIYFLIYLEWKNLVKWKQAYFKRYSFRLHLILVKDITETRSEFAENFLLERFRSPSISELHVILFTRNKEFDQYFKKHDKLLCSYWKSLRRLRCSKQTDHNDTEIEECNNLNECSSDQDLQLFSNPILREIKTNQELLLSLSDSSKDFYPCAILICPDPNNASMIRLLPASTSNNFVCSLPPDPFGLNWKNMGKTYLERKFSRTLMTILTVCIILFWAVPIGFVASLANLISISKQYWDDDVIPKFIQYFFSTFFPVLCIWIFHLALPMIFTIMSRYEGHLSKVTIDREIFTKLSVFNIFDTLLLFLVSGSLVSNIKLIIETPIQVASILAQTIPSQSNFFLIYISMCTFILNPWELLQGNYLILYFLNKIWIRKQCQGALSFDLRPLRTKYTIYYVRMIYMFGLGVCFSLLSPLIIPIWLLFCVSSYICFSYNEVHNTYETHSHDGDHWPQISKWILIYLFVGQLLMIGMFSIKKHSIIGFVSFPLLISTLSFLFFINKRFLYSYENPTLDTLSTTPKLNSKSLDFVRILYNKTFRIPHPLTRKMEHLMKESFKLRRADAFSE